MITQSLQTLGHKSPADLINGRAAITRVVYGLSGYLDLQAHLFQRLKSKGVRTRANGRQLGSLSLICWESFIPNKLDSSHGHKMAVLGHKELKNNEKELLCPQVKNNLMSFLKHYYGGLFHR